MKNRPDWFKHIYFIGLLLVAVTLPFAKHYNSWMVGVVILGWLAEGRFHDKWQRLKQHRWWFFALGFYLIQVLALLYTENTARGGFILEKKTGLWLIPLLIATGPPITAKQLQQVLRAFVGACTLGALICLAMASYSWFQSGDLEAFSHHKLSKHIGINAIYLSAFLVFGLFVLGQWLFQAWSQLGHIIRLVIIAWIGLITFTVLLLASKTLIFTLLLLGSGSWVVWFSSQGRTLIGILSMLGIFLVLLLTIVTIPDTRARFSSVLDSQFEVVNTDHYVYSTPFNGLTLRLVLWKFGFEVLQEEQALLVGTGPGDVQPLMDANYLKNGIYTGNPDLGDHGYLGYNLHNQYLQTLLGTGLLGLLTLVAWLAALFMRAWREGRWLALLLLAEVALFSITESTLETHHGTLLLAFLGSLVMVAPAKFTT